MERNSKILLVDDEPDFIADMQAKLLAKGWQVLPVGTRLQAEEVARREKPDLIILGTIMPRGDAFRLHQWLKQSPDFREVPLIVVDAPVEKRLIKGWRMDEGLKLEAEQYVIKPVESSSVVVWVEKFLDKTLRRIKVLVVDDHAVVREGICALLSLQKDMEVIGEAVDGRDAIDKVQRLTPNVAVMDIVMPVMSGLEATKRITAKYPGTKVLILTQYDEEENMFVAKQVGAYGFVAKSAASSDLLTGIRTVGEGRYFPRSFAYVSANWPEGRDKNK
ncbi:MAG TPA: response regulator [Dehalococcoidia bacterium]